jgi:hypothetical protein
MLNININVNIPRAFPIPALNYSAFSNPTSMSYSIVDKNLAEGFLLYIVAIRSGNFLGRGLLAAKLNTVDMKLISQ